MASIGDLQSRALRDLIGTRNYGVATVNLQNATATFDSLHEPDGGIVVSINGAVTFLTPRTDEALVTLAALQGPITGYEGYYSQPVSTTVYYLWVVTAAGADYVIQGTYEDQVLGSLAPITRGTGLIPDIAVADTYCPIAVFKVVNGATAVWIPGTTNWNATSVTSSASPVCMLPAAASALTFTAGGA